MRILAVERAVCERFLPGLDAKLADIPLMTLEATQNEGIALFRAAGGAGLMIPEIHGGAGASAVEAVRINRALAARSPSLALAATMHHFSVASLLAVSQSSEGPEWMLLDAVAKDHLLIASAFAEGKTSQSILEPTMSAVWDGNHWRVSGRKQPCSLSRSMDILTASVLMEHPEKGRIAGVALIPANTPGITVEPFWKSWVLAGAESDAVILEAVKVPPELMFEFKADLKTALDDLQTLGFIWFELLMSAAYLGVAAALVERVMRAGKGALTERVKLGVALEGAALVLDGAARNLDDGDTGNDALARSLIARYTVSESIRSIVAHSVELLGGMAFISHSDVAYLAAASHAIGFHPPSRLSAAEGLMQWFSGHSLEIK